MEVPTNLVMMLTHHEPVHGLLRLLAFVDAVVVTSEVFVRGYPIAVVFVDVVPVVVPVVADHDSRQHYHYYYRHVLLYFVLVA